MENQPTICTHMFEWMSAALHAGEDTNTPRRVLKMHYDADGLNLEFVHEDGHTYKVRVTEVR